MPKACQIVNVAALISQVVDLVAMIPMRAISWPKCARSIVKLMAMIGAFLGWQAALLTLFLGCVFGAFVGVALTLRGGLLARIPFGPYLAMGALTALFWGDQLVELLFVQWPEWQRQNPSSIYLVLTVGVGALLAMLLLLRRARR